MDLHPLNMIYRRNLWRPAVEKGVYQKTAEHRYAVAAADVYHFILGQHRTIPALRLKHRSGSCGTASAAPRSPYRHLELCGIALDKMVDTRPGSEWFWQTDKYGTPAHKPIVGPWKCPYHNGRMCMELMRRNPDVNV